VCECGCVCVAMKALCVLLLCVCVVGGAAFELRDLLALSKDARLVQSVATVDDAQVCVCVCVSLSVRVCV